MMMKKDEETTNRRTSIQLIMSIQNDCPLSYSTLAALKIKYTFVGGGDVNGLTFYK